MFDGVRCAVLLLMLHRLTKQLQAQQDSSGQAGVISAAAAARYMCFAAAPPVQR